MADIIETPSDEVIVLENNNPNIIQFPDPLVIITEDPSIIHYEIDKNIIIETGVQGPAGPPTGVGTNTYGINFVGLSTGPGKTTTSTNGTRIFEEFEVGDELWSMFVLPDDIDRTQDIQMFGMFFTIQDQPDANRLASWQIDVTSHSHLPYNDINQTYYVIDAPVKETAYDHVHGWIYLDHVTLDFENCNVLSFKITRLASSNDPVGNIGLVGMEMRIHTDGRVGLTGPQGPPGDEQLSYAKQIDWVDDSHVYIGEADAGTATSAASWRIKYTVFQTDDDASVTWADGDDLFDNIWDNRATYSYS